MTIRQFAFKNVFRNKRLYIAYFLSSLFTVMVFFTFALFAFHPTFRNEDFNQYALFGMAVAGGIIYIFSFFFVLYSMSSFLQSRKKEFGLLILLGAADRQIRRMVFMENILIGFFATIGGILTGIVFSKGILLIAENILIIESALPFYFPTYAILVTFFSFMLLFLCISFFVSFILRTRKLIDLIKGDKKSKGEPKASIILSILAAILLTAGYITALIVEGLKVLVVMIPVIVVVVIGTYLLFTQLSVYIIRSLKKNTSIFWKKTNMVLLSDLSFRMKDNARTFFIVAIISTVAFSAIGTLYGLQSYLTKGVKSANPYTLTYQPWGDDDKEVMDQDFETINNIFDEENIETKMEFLELTYYLIEENKYLIVKASDYNRFAALIDEDLVQVGPDEAIVVEQSQAMISDGPKASETLKKIKIPLSNGKELVPSTVIETEIIPAFYGYYIVNDNVYEELGEPESIDYSAAWQAQNGDKEQYIEAGRKIFEQVPYKTTSVDYILFQIEQAYGPILFIGLFIGIVFFVSAGSFLYFRLFTDLDDDKQKFKSIARIGLSTGELKKIVNRQIALLFMSPIIVALIHGTVALTALSHFFNYNLTTESTIVLGSFAAIQVIYFLIVRFFYIKQLKNAIY